MSNNELPIDLWLTVMSYLDYRDLASCSLVNSEFNELSEHDSLWRPLCRKYWLETNCPDAETSWKEHFSKWHSNFGKYVHCYARIKKAWDKILNFMKDSCPEIYSSILPGVSEDKLDSIEEKIKFPLPTDMRCSYRIRNGQKLNAPGLLGSISISNHFRSEALLDLDIASEGMPDRRGFVGCMPLTFCIHTGYCELIALSAQYDLTPGIIFTGDEDNVNPRTSFKYIFILGKNFTSWFTGYANSLCNGRYKVNNNQLYRFHHKPECIAQTGNIFVTAATCFIPEYSNANLTYFYSYQITMWMSDEAPSSQSCQLETRHWIITDENGDEERVDGPGVIGEYPIMRPGAEFSWISCTSFKTTYGNMKGHFMMRNLRTGDHTEVACPIFHMKCPPYMSVNLFQNLYQSFE